MYDEGVEGRPCLDRLRPQFFAVCCAVNGTDHPDGLLCPCMQVVIGYEQAELVNGVEGLAGDPGGFRSGCHVRRTVLFLVLAVPPVVLTPYDSSVAAVKARTALRRSRSPTVTVGSGQPGRGGVPRCMRIRRAASGHTAQQRGRGARDAGPSALGRVFK